MGWRGEGKELGYNLSGKLEKLFVWEVREVGKEAKWVEGLTGVGVGAGWGDEDDGFWCVGCFGGEFDGGGGDGVAGGVE